MKGPLKTILLQEIQKEPNTAYGLIQTIQENTGWKPSYGSVHPQLQKLHEEKLIKKQEDNNKIIWSLTKKGEQELKKISPELIKRLEEDMNVLAHICGVNQKTHQEITRIFLQSIQQGEQPFKEVQEELTQLQLSFWKLYEQKKVAKNKNKINKLVQEMRKELEEL